MPLKTNKSIFYYMHRTGSVWTSKVISSMLDAEDITVSSREMREKNHRRYKFGLFGRHTAPSDIEKNAKEGLFSFCFVRHPLGWYKSMWGIRMDRDQSIDPRFILSKCWSTSFEEFVENAINTFPEGFLTQMYQYFVEKDLTGVNFIGLQENLREDLIKALTLAGEEFDEKVIRNQKRVNFSKEREGLELSKELQARLLKSESWVINNFYK